MTTKYSRRNKKRKSAVRKKMWVWVLPALILFTAGAFLIQPAESLAPQVIVEEAWMTATDIGQFQYRTNIEQTTRPLLKLANVGVTPKTDHFYIEGESNLPADEMQMQLWQGSGDIVSGSDSIEMRVIDGKAEGRVADGAWELVDNFGDGFAPNGDPLGFLVAAENVEFLSEETKVLPESIASVTNQAAITYRRYAFAIDGPAFGRYMRDQMEADLRDRGELPPGINLDVARTYAEMEADGELWLDEGGLPLRQILHITFPEGEFDQVTAVIQTDFTNWARPEPTPVASFSATVASAGTAVQTTVSAVVPHLVTLLLFAGFAFLLNSRTFRTRTRHGIIAAFIVFSMVGGPLLQVAAVGSYFDRHGGQIAHEESSSRLEEMGYRQTDFQASVSPLEQTAVMQPAALPIQIPTINGLPSSVPSHQIDFDGPDSDGDGLTDAFERRIGTNAASNDSDGDGLQDQTELDYLGTDPEDADTDGDRLPDNIEVEGFLLADGTTRRFLNPHDPDTNRDTLPDGLECPTGQNCPDTDGDGEPDVFDIDNDGDGVPDWVDSSVNTVLGGTTGDDAFDLFEYQLDDLTADKITYVDFQIRPIDPNHLWYSHNVLDWPSADRAGQVQRVNDTTWAEQPDSIDPRDHNGDIKLIPMLEIEIPYENGYPGLPIQNGVTNIQPDDAVTAWLDQALADSYGLSVRKKDNSGTLIVYVAASLLRDKYGDNIVAFSGRMPYWPSSGSFGGNHKIRLAWLVNMLVDSCDPPENSPEDYCDDVNNWQESQQVVHAYYDHFQITGMKVTEDLGLETAVVFENPAATGGNAHVEDRLWTVSQALDNTFIAGRSEDGTTRDMTIAEVEQRWNAPSSATEAERFGIPSDALLVETFSYADQTGVAAIATTESEQILTTHFGAADQPTLLFLMEARSRTSNMTMYGAPGNPVKNNGDGITDGVIAGNFINLNLKPIPETLVATMKWSKFAFDGPAGMEAWQAVDLVTQWDEFDTELAPIFPDHTTNNITAGKLLLVKSYYLALHEGVTSFVEVGGEANEEADDPFDNVFYTEDGGQELFGNMIDSAIDNYKGAVNSAIVARAGMLNSNIGTRDRILMGLGGIKDGVVDNFFNEPTKRKSGSAAFQASLAASLAVGASALNIAKTIVSVTGVSEEDAAFIGHITGIVNTTTAIGGVYKGLKAAIQDVDYFLGLNNVKTLSNSLKMAAFIGIIVSVVTQLGVFLGGIAGGALEPGSEAFNRAIVNMTLMIVASLVLIAIAQIPVVGQLLVALIVIFDTVANLICGFLGVSGGVCNGVVGTVVAAIADFFYGSEEPAVDLQHKDRLQINGIDFAFDPPGLGASKTSTMTVTADVTTRVFATNHEFYKVLGSRSFGRQRTSTFVYKLAFNKLPDFHDSLNKNEMGEPGWMFDEDKHVYAANRLPATDYVLSQSGVNAKMPSLWLAEGYAIETTRCILGCIFNRVGTDRGTFHHVLSRDLYIDVFPETLDEFMTFAWDTGIPFPVQVDRDGDGLRTNIAQTNDPDDTTPDTDGDGLSDFYEIHHGTSETRADSDSDGLSDYEELRYRTSSANRDSDGDGLSDLEEVTGWEFIYYEGGSRQIMLVTSDPLQPDTDGDGLSDFAEFQYRLNPRAAGSFGSFSFAMSPPEPYIFVDGSTIDYEATATNSLPAGRTAVGEFSIALEDEIPDQQTAAFAIGASDSQTFSGQLTLNASAMITGQLDIEAYAGGVVGELVAQPAYPDNMILYYPFDDVGVDKLKSSVGPNSFECNDDCALYYSQLDGVVGRGLYVDTDIVTAQTPTIRAIDDTVSLSAAGTTVGFWLRPDAPGNFLTFENNNGPGYLWMRMTGGSRNLDIYTSSCRGTVGSTSSNVVLPLNEWNHVVVSFRAETPDIPKNIEPPDRSSGINIRYFEPTSSREVQAFDVWLNGVHVDTDTIDALINGCGFTQLQLAPSFRGSIDELFVLNGSLAPNDTFVPALYNYQRSWFQEYATETIFVDNENPSVWFKGVENIPVSAESHIIQIEAVDHVGGSGIDRVEYRLLPDGLWQPATRDGEAWFFSHDLSIGNPLVHFELRAFDRAGNSSEDGGSETNWTVSGDLFGPMVVVQRYTVRSRGRSASAQGLEDGFLEISGTYSDDYSVERLIIELLDENGDLFGIPVQTAGNGDGTWNVDYPIPAEVDGSYTVRATAVDFVGNETVALSNGPVFGDATAPVGAVSMLDETAGLFHGTVSDFRQPTNPTVHFHFEEAAGATTFYDSSIRQLNATCTTCPTADQAGHTGQAIAFNGVDQVIEVPYQDDLLFGGSFGFSGWFHLNSNSSQPLVQHNGFSLRTNADGTLFAAMATLPNNEYLLNTPTVVPTNAWFHLAMTWRAGEDAVVYLDGTQVTSFATDGIELDNGVEPTLMLGSNGFTFMNGLVDDVRLYKRPFTPTDINLLANQAGSNVAQAWIGYAHMQDGFETASQAPNFWQPITLDTPNASFSTWTAPVPLGLEGIYDIALKISDSEGNERVMESVWNTAFDSLAPRMTLGGDVFTPWSIFSGIQITDFNLLPVDENLSNDPVWNYYVQNSYLNDSWYTDFTDEKRLYEMNSFGQLVIPRQPADALRACDSVGNCTTAVPLTSGIISLIHDVYPGNAAEIAIDTPLSNRLSFGTVGSGNGQLSTPQDIEVGPSNIYVADFGNNRVQIFDLSGNYVDQIAVNLPKDIALDPVTEDIYVAGGLSAGFNFVRKFDQNGTQLGNWFFPVLIDAVATDEAGNVYVSDLTNCNILKFDNSFTQIDTWGTTCGAEFSSNIRSIAVDRADYGSLSGYDDSKNNVYILDSRAVKRYTSDGTFVSQFVLPFSQADGGGVAPNAIAVDWRGDLYVADYSNNFNNDAHRIQKFSPDGVFLGSWGEKGFAPGEMNGLSGVAVGLGDSLYVVEEVGHRIQQLPIVPHHAALDDIYPDDGDAFISAVSTYLPDSGIYAFTASLPAGMTLQDISCMSTSGAASTLTNVATGQLTLNYTAGDGYICTFTSQANGGSVANMVQTVTHIETEAAIAERSSQLAAPRSYLLTSGGTNSLDPVDFQIFGDTDAGLQGISLWEGANQIGLENWGVGERDSQLVTFSWTPPAEGQYDLVSIVEDWNNVSAVNPAVPFLVDVTSPSLSLSTASVSSANMNEDGFITVNGSVSDNLGLAKLEIAIDNGDWQEVALPTSGSNFSVTVNGGFSELPESGNIIIEGRATDKVGNVTTDPFLVPIDAVPPVLVDITLRRDAVNGPIVEPGSLIADTATPTLWLNWTASSDASGIARYWVGWTDSPDISDVTGLTEFSNATTDASFPLSEISRKFAHVVAEDTFGNRSFQTIYSPIYVDQQQTPDYINMDENGIPYRNWVNNGCGLVGVDYRADRAAEGRDEFGHPQGLAVTWDATDLRLNWSGANWRTDGDLFIYLDTAAGGSDRAYNPYPASQSDTVIILPVDESSQMLADYVIWVEEDGNTATLLAWNGSSWVAQPSNVWDYFFDVNTAVPQTDIAIPFAQLGIANPAASSLSLVAFASEEDRLRLWATSPASNFVNSEQVLDIETDQYLHLFALTERYEWASLGSGVCPNANQPEPTADLQFTLSSDQAGTSYNPLADGLFFAMRDLSLYQNLINWQAEWNAICANNSGHQACEKANPFDTSSLDYNSTQGLQTVEDTNHEPLGNGDTVNYTLHATNFGDATATAVSLTVQASGPLTLDGGGTQLVLNVGSLAPGQTAEFNFGGTINTGVGAQDEVAAIDVTITQNNRSATATVDSSWISLDIPVDANPPRHVEILEPLGLIGPNVTDFVGVVADDGEVPTLELRIQESGQPDIVENCTDTTPVDGAWVCQWDAGGAANDTVYTIDVRATDDEGLQSAYGGARSYIVDAQAPTVAVDASPFTAGLVGLNDDILSGTAVDNRLLSFVEVCEVDGADENCELADFYLTTPTEIVSTFSYPDAPASPIAIDAATSCGGSEIVRTFNVTDSFVIDDVNLGLNIDHAYRADVVATLTSPAGTAVVLLSGGLEADNYDVLLDDSALQTAVSDGLDHLTDVTYYENRRAPQAALTAFNGENSAGTWSLAICDADTGMSDGAYNHAELQLQAVNVPASTDGAWSYVVAWDDADDGTNKTFRIYATDSVGNRSVAQTINFDVDLTPPTLVVNDPAGTLPIDGTANDASGVAEVSIGVVTLDDESLVDDVTLIGNSWSYETAVPLFAAGGASEVWITAVDNAGNTSSDGPYTIVTDPVGPGGVGQATGEPDLALWLRADRNVTMDGSNAVSNWGDFSGYGRDATQATGNSQPLFVADGLNGEPTLRFDGIDDFLDLAASSIEGVDGFTVFSVFNWHTASTWQRLWDFGNGTGSNFGYLVPEAAGSVARFGIITPSGGDNRVDTTTATPTNSGQLLSLDWPSAGSASLARNGGNLGSATVTSQPSDIGTINHNFIGKSIWPDPYLDADIAEFIIFHDTLTAVEQTHVELYLQDKYSLDMAGFATYQDGGYNDNVQGISQSAQVVSTSGLGGLQVNDDGFLQEADDLFLVGHDGNTGQTTNDSPSTLLQRWNRIWKGEVNDAGSNNGTVDLLFDYSDSGIEGLDSFDLVLLTRAATSGDFTIVSNAMVDVGGSSVLVTVDLADLDTYFTIGEVQSTWTVCSTGCDYTTIQAAINAPTTLDGHTIVIVDPVHTEHSIVVSKDLTIRGLFYAIDSVVQAAENLGDVNARVFTVNAGKTVRFEDLTIQHGYFNNGVAGAGIYNNGGDVTILRSIIRNNRVEGPEIGGGIISVQPGSLTIGESSIINNHADRAGGGIATNTVDTIYNSTISGNSSNGTAGPWYGGGLYIGSSGNVAISYSTIAANTAKWGGGIGGHGNATLVGSIVAGNSATDSGHDLFTAGGSYTSGGYNVIGRLDAGLVPTTGDQVGSDATPLDPMLATLGNSGDLLPVHPLLDGSPAIDNGDGTVCLGNLIGLGDQNGRYRFDNSLCDSGAYEADSGPVFTRILAALDGLNLVIDWWDNILNNAYEIHSSTTPYFEMDETTLTNTLPGPINVYTITNGANETRFYRVNITGGEQGSLPTNEIGVFTFDIVPGN